MKLTEAFSPEESKKIYDNFMSIIGTRRDKLVKRYGAEAEKVAYAKAVKQVKKQAEEKPMEKEIEEGTCGHGIDGKIGNKPAGPDMLVVKLREMVKDALKKPVSEKFTPKHDDKFDDKRKNLPDGLQKAILKKQGKLDEDLDLGHQDDEPGMLKADVYRIGKYAMELYKMLDKFDKIDSEVDFPHWWQSKITKAKSMIVSAKHYLDFEMKEPQIDAMVDVASEEGVIDESIMDADSSTRELMSLIKIGKVKGDAILKVKGQEIGKLKDLKGSEARMAYNAFILPSQMKKRDIKIEEGVIDEKKLTTAEKNKKEDIIKGIAKQKGGKDKLKDVDYAVATDRAKKLAEAIFAKLKS